MLGSAGVPVPGTRDIPESGAGYRRLPQSVGFPRHSTFPVTEPADTRPLRHDAYVICPVDLEAVLGLRNATHRRSFWPLLRAVA